jgi:NAD(P)H-dependent FMN reductase
VVKNCFVVGGFPRLIGDMIEIIVGTNRPGANSRKVAAQILDIYQQQGVDAALLDLAELPPEIFSPSAYAEKPAAFAGFSDRALKADGLLVVTPEYNGGAPGVLKYFIEMLKYPDCFAGKPVAFVGVAAGSWGALRPVEQLEQIFVNLGAPVYPTRVFIPGVRNELDADGKLKSAEIIARLAGQAKGFAAFIAR